MTMVVIALLNGKSKEEWYDLVAKRVADGDGPCAPPEYGKFPPLTHQAESCLTDVQLNSVAPE